MCILLSLNTVFTHVMPALFFFSRMILLCRITQPLAADYEHFSSVVLIASACRLASLAHRRSSKASRPPCHSLLFEIPVTLLLTTAVNKTARHVFKIDMHTSSAMQF